MDCFHRRELLNWNAFNASYGPVLRDGTEDEPATDVFATGTEDGERRWQDFKKRVVQHVRSLGYVIEQCGNVFSLTEYSGLIRILHKDFHVEICRSTITWRKGT